MLPQPAQHGDVAVERQPRRDRAVGADLEVGERARGSRSRASRRARSGCSASISRQRCGPPGAAARAPRGTPPSRGSAAHGSIQPPSTQHDAADELGVAGARARARRCRPRTGPATTGRSSSSALDQRGEIVRDGRRCRTPPSGFEERPWPRRSTVDDGVARGGRARLRRRPTSGRSRRARGPARTAPARRSPWRAPRRRPRGRRPGRRGRAGCAWEEYGRGRTADRGAGPRQPSSWASGSRKRNAAPLSPLVPAVIEEPIASRSWLVTYSPIPVPDACFAVCGAR